MQFTEDSSANTRVAAQPKLSLERLKTIKVPIPNIYEQRRIVAILDDAFERIDKAIANTEKNIANAKELFESFSGIFFSKQSSGKAKLVSLDDVASITSKLVNPTQAQFLDTPHIGAANIISTSTELIDVKTAREDNLISGKFIFDETVVLYSKIRPYLKKVAIPNFQGLCSADIYPIAPQYGKVSRDFLFFLLLSKNFTDYAISVSDRAGMPKVNREHLFKYTLHLPTLREQQNIVNILSKALSSSKLLVQCSQHKLASLRTLKQSLLAAAFSGELTADFNPDTLEL